MLWIALLVIASLFFLFIIIVAIANRLFNQNVVKVINELFEDYPEQEQKLIQKEDLTRLPNPVQKWLEISKVIGKEKVISLRLKQQGLMISKEGGPWMPVDAEQYFRVDKPGFVWKAKVKMAPLLHLSGLDNYQKGKGKMGIKILSLFPVVDAKGPEMDQGTLLRYLAEMCWFPAGALSPYITWEPIDSTSAKAILSYKGKKDSGIFTFDEKGDLVCFTTKRFREMNGKYVLTTWKGVPKEYKEFEGVKIPCKTDIVWEDETGDFTWFQCKIVELEYNKPRIYGR